MSYKKFFIPRGPFTLMELAKIANCEIVIPYSEVLDTPVEEKLILNVATLGMATSSEISFLSNARYSELFKVTEAGACIIKDENIPIAPSGTVLLIHDDPYLAYAKIASKFYPKEVLSSISQLQHQINSSSKIHETAVIAPGAFIGEGAEIGKDCIIHSNAYIGNGVIIGSSTIVYQGAIIQYALVGENCIIHPGVKIGQDGFGYASSKKEGIVKIPQIGGVIIGNNVEIGANTCIDRGALEDTIIGSGTKIDNLVQIGHNVIVGENCIIVAQVGIAGSTKIGDGAMIAGQAGISGHLSVGDNAVIAGGSGVTKNVADGTKVAGYPAINIQDWHRQVIFLKNSIKKQDE